MKRRHRVFSGVNRDEQARIGFHQALSALKIGCARDTTETVAAMAALAVFIVYNFSIEVVSANGCLYADQADAQYAAETYQPFVLINRVRFWLVHGWSVVFFSAGSNCSSSLAFTLSTRTPSSPLR